MLRLDRRFSLDLVQAVHRIRQTEPYAVESRSCDSLLIYLRGGHDYMIDDRRESAGEGQLVYIPRGLKYVNYPHTGELDYYQIELSLEDEHGQNRLFDDWFALSPERTVGLLPILVELYRTFADGGSRRMLDAYGQLTIFLRAVCDAVGSMRSESDRFAQIRLASERIDTEYMMNTPIEQLAHELAISLSSLERGFRELYDCSPLEYRNDRRLERAKLLLAGGLSVTETAYSVGFSSICYFSRLFKRSFGLSPSEYARKVYSREG